MYTDKSAGDLLWTNPQVIWEYLLFWPMIAKQYNLHEPRRPITELETVDRQNHRVTESHLGYLKLDERRNNNNSLEIRNNTSNLRRAKIIPCIHYLLIISQILRFCFFYLNENRWYLVLKIWEFNIVFPYFKLLFINIYWWNTSRIEDEDSFSVFTAFLSVCFARFNYECFSTNCLF